MTLPLVFLFFFDNQMFFIEIFINYPPTGKSNNRIQIMVMHKQKVDQQTHISKSSFDAYI